MNSANVRIVSSPFNPSVEVVDTLLIKLHVPYSKSDVTVVVNPNIVDYQDHVKSKGIDIRQISFSVPTDETKNLHFDFERDNQHTITMGETTYTLKLMSITEENIQGQNFPVFAFHVTW